MVYRGRSSRGPRFRGGGRSMRRGSSPRGGRFESNRESELMSKLSRIRSRDTDMALEIVNAVLAAKDRDRAPSSKFRRTERGRASSSYKSSRSSYSGNRSRRDDSVGRKRRFEDIDEEGKDHFPSNIDVPIQALWCKICNTYDFSSKEKFSAHMKGKYHAFMKSDCKSRNKFILKLLRGHSRMQTIGRSYPESCRVCHGTFEGKYTDHKASLTHDLVESFLKKRCCGKFLDARESYDEHCLSPKHLETKYEELKMWAKSEPEETKEEEDGSMKSISLSDLDELTKRTEKDLDKFTEMKESLIKEHNEDPESTTLPEFDKENPVPVGIRFLTGSRVFRCKACVIEIPGTSTDVIKSHLQSVDHYMEVMRHTAFKDEIKKQLNRKDEEVTEKKEDSEKKDGEDKDDTKDEEELFNETELHFEEGFENPFNQEETDGEGGEEFHEGDETAEGEEIEDEHLEGEEEHIEGEEEQMEGEEHLEDEHEEYGEEQEEYGEDEQEYGERESMGEDQEEAEAE